MRVLVVGQGGREHALARQLKSSPLCKQLWVLPGNPGMERDGIACYPAKTPEEIFDFARREHFDIAVLGPETAILSDLKELLESQKIRVFAPSQRAALLESSKNYCKEILAMSGVPTAKFQVAHDLQSANDLILTHDFSAPLVVKADGLAQGKGVAVVETMERALAAVRELSQSYGFPVLIEECLVGPELSAFALCDNEDFVILGTACDYKRITPDAFSANTGGMGAYSPCDFLTVDDHHQIHSLFQKTLKTMVDTDVPFQGFLFAGLMKTAKGIYTLEFNVRMGDPETQALLPRLKTDLLSVIDKALNHDLSTQEIEHVDESSVHVVMVSQGYPEKQMLLGKKLTLPLASSDAKVFFAGVSGDQDGLFNSGGRVLGVTALAKTKEDARKKAYQEIKRFQFEGCYYREDIAQ